MKTGFRLRYFYSLMGLLFTVNAWAVETLRLQHEDLPRLVQGKNQSVSGTKLMTEASEQRTGHLVRSFLPSVRAHAGGETFQTGPYGTMTQPFGALEARVNLYQGGRDALEEDIRKGQVTLSNAIERRTFQSELKEARRTFWNLIFVREMIAILKDAKTQNETNLSAATRRISRGLTGKTDRLEFEINSSRIREDIASLEHEDLMVEIKLASVLGLPLDTQFETPQVAPHEHHEQETTMKLAAETNQEVQSLQANSQIASAQKGINQRWWMPSLDVYSEYALFTLREREYLSLQDRNDIAVGVRLTLNLFDGLQSKNAASTFAIQAEGLGQQASQKARAVEAEFRIAQEEMKHDHELIHEAERRIEQGKVYLASTLDEYDRGVKNSPDVLGATERQVAFRRRYAELRRDYHIARGDLLAVLGK